MLQDAENSGRPLPSVSCLQIQPLVARVALAWKSISRWTDEVGPGKRLKEWSAETCDPTPWLDLQILERLGKACSLHGISDLQWQTMRCVSELFLQLRAELAKE